MVAILPEGVGGGETMHLPGVCLLIFTQSPDESGVSAKFPVNNFDFLTTLHP